MIEVSLSKYAQNIQFMYATLDNHVAYAEKRRNSHGRRDNKIEELGGEDWRIRFKGWGPELAVRQEAGLDFEWHDAFAVDISPCIEVRGQPYDYYGLKFRKCDKQKTSRIWIAVSYQRAPLYRLLMWATSEELNDSRYWDAGKRIMNDNLRSWDENPFALMPIEEGHTDFAPVFKKMLDIV
jgi:hypothetical protein